MSGLVQDAEAVLEIGETTTAEVVADTDAILQVLSNLIENGIKYGQARGDSHCTSLVSAREVRSDPIEARRVQRPRLWPGDRLRTPQPHLRAVLPGRQSALARVRRHRAGAGNRAAYGADPGRIDSRRKRAERRQHVPFYIAERRKLASIAITFTVCNLAVTMCRSDWEHVSSSGRIQSSPPTKKRFGPAPRMTTKESPDCPSSRRSYLLPYRRRDNSLGREPRTPLEGLARPSAPI